MTVSSREAPVIETLPDVRMLVVDSEPELAAELAELFAGTGCEIVVEPSCARARERIAAERPELVTIHHDRDDIDGDSLVHEIFANGRAADEFGVILVGAGVSEMMSEYRDRGLVDVIPLPPTGPVLRIAMAAIVRARRRAIALRRKERRIERAKRELERLFDSIRDGIVLIDRDFTVQRVNQAALDMFGHDGFGAVLGRKCHQALYGSETICENCPAVRSFNSGEYEESELTHRPAGGGCRYHRVATIPSEWSEGDPECVERLIEVTEDVTEVRELRDRQVESQKIEAIAHLAGAASHEVNQPLGAISGRAQLSLMNLAGGKLTLKDVGRDMREIIGNVQRIDEIIRKMRSITNYVTKPYVDGTRILDIDRSSADS